MAVQQRTGKSSQGGLRVEATLGKRQGVLPDVAGQNMNRPAAPAFIHAAAHRKSDRIGFLPGGTACAQDAKTLSAVMGLARLQVGKNFSFERRKGRGMAEEAGFPIQQLLEQPFTFRV